MRGILHIAVMALATALAAGRADAKDFNEYVLRAVTHLNDKYAGGGYDIRSFFTHNIPYADGQVSKSSSQPDPAPSMCVAAVTEVMLTAINMYVDETEDRSPYTKAPLSLWTRGNALSLRANLFMYAGTKSRGTGHTLSRFGMGRELGFEALKPGDFINLNRNPAPGKSATGHAVVFLGYLDGQGGDLPTAAGAKGFKYFSSQGKGRADAGFGYRWAFFDGTCPTLTGGRVRDCRVIRSANPALLNAGRMSEPDDWTVANAIASLREEGLRDIMGTNPGISRALADDELERDLPSAIDPAYDGESGE